MGLSTPSWETINPAVPISSRYRKGRQLTPPQANACTPATLPNHMLQAVQSRHRYSLESNSQRVLKLTPGAAPIDQSWHGRHDIYRWDNPHLAHRSGNVYAYCAAAAWRALSRQSERKIRPDTSKDYRFWTTASSPTFCRKFPHPLLETAGIQLARLRKIGLSLRGSVVPLLKGCTGSLEEVHIINCNVPDFPVAEILQEIFKHGRTLKVFSLGKYRPMDTDQFFKLAHECSQLEHLMVGVEILDWVCVNEAQFHNSWLYQLFWYAC